MKAIKYLFIGVGLILLLMVIAVGVFLATFDANQYKQDLSDLVKQQTGRDLVFQGDIGLSLYPSLGMTLGSMTFSNAPGFGQQPMLSVKQASVSVDVLSLLSFQPEIAQLVLDELSVDLQKNQQGKTNWDDLVKADGKAVPDKDIEPEKPAKQDAPELTLGAFGGLNITNASLNWNDQSAGVNYQVQNLSLKTGRISPDQAFPLSLRMTLKSLNELSADVDLSADVLFKNQKLLLSNLQLQTNALGEMLPVDQLQLALGGDVDFSLESQQLGIKGFDTQVKTLGGALQSSQVSLAGEIGYDLNQAHLTVGVLDLQANLQGDSIPKGQLKAGLSADKLDVNLTDRAVTLNGLVLALNENQFNGQIKVTDYAQPAVTFKLSSERFDVDSLLGDAAKQASTEQPGTPSPAEDTQIQLPMELLRDLQLKGELTVGTLIAQGLTVTDVLLQMSANNGIINLDPMQMHLYDGQFSGSVRINAQGNKPQYRVTQKLSSFQIGRFLADFMGDDPVSGQANLNLSLQTQGDWLSQLKQNLNGDLAVAINDGALKGFNLRHEVESAKARFRGEKEPEPEQKKTDFSALSLSGVIKDGVLSTDDLNLQAPLLRVGGTGSLNLVKENVDYLVKAKLVGTSKGQQGGEADELRGLLIPVAIKGKWLDPKIDVQLDEMMKAKLDAEKAQLRKQVEQEKAALQQKLADEKAKLKQAQQKEAAAKKAQLEKQRALEEAEQKAKLEAKKKEEEEKAKKKLEEKLKKLF